MVFEHDDRNPYELSCLLTGRIFSTYGISSYIRRAVYKSIVGLIAFVCVFCIAFHDDDDDDGDADGDEDDGDDDDDADDDW